MGSYLLPPYVPGGQNNPAHDRRTERHPTCKETRRVRTTTFLDGGTHRKKAEPAYRDTYRANSLRVWSIGSQNTVFPFSMTNA